MRRLLPHPVLSAALFSLWLVMSGTFAPAQLLLAAILAIVIPFLSDRFFDDAVKRVRLRPALELALIVAWDILVANVVVARLVLGPLGRLRPCFIEVPLATANPRAITLLASIITMVPGAVSVDIDDARTRILIHALDVEQSEALVARIKQRYERRLKEMFEC